MALLMYPLPLFSLVCSLIGESKSAGVQAVILLSLLASSAVGPIEPSYDL